MTTTRVSFRNRKRVPTRPGPAGWVCAAALAFSLGATHAGILINLDATSQPLGPLATWPNAGTLSGDFQQGDPTLGGVTPEVVLKDGVKAVLLLAGTVTGDEGTHYVGPDATVVSGNASRTSEAWVWHASGGGESTIISWGHRGGSPDGSNWTFNHSADNTWGAVGIWGAPDIGYADKEVYGRWTYVVATYEGGAVNRTTVYVDGVQVNTENPVPALNTFATDNTGRPLPFRIGRQSLANGLTADVGISTDIYLGRIRVHDMALTPAQVAAQFEAEKAQFGLTDTDSDGIEDWFENRYSTFLNPNDASDAAKDQDADGATNLTEFQKGTLPDNPDTDGDGLKDGVETGTGVWVSVTDTGTNPLNPDTDGDTLRDAVETNTGKFVSANDTGTNPLKTDSDGDTYDDAGEIRLGSDPANPNSVPAVGTWAQEVTRSAPKYWYRFEETDPSQPAKNEIAATGFTGAYGPEITSADLGKASVIPSLGKAIEFTGPAASASTGKYVDLGATAPDPGEIPELTNFRPPAVDKTTTVEYWIRTTHRADAANQTWNSPALLGHESPGDGDMYWGWLNNTGQFGFSTSDLMEIFVPGVTDGQWHHIVLIKEWHVNQPCRSTLYLDGGTAQGGRTVTATTPAGSASYQDTDGGIRYLGLTQSGGSGNNQFIGTFDELVIYDRALTETEVRLHFRVAAEADTDGDGMADAYEIANGLDPNVNDANQDLDNDGSPNYQEFLRKTNPQVADTDGDGLKDGVETNTGVYVSATDTGTDPLVRDMDGDGLSDGADISAGTSPFKSDTDGDGFKDSDELALGTSPTDANSKPALASDWATAVKADAPRYWWRFEGTTTSAGVPNEGSVAGFNGTFGAGIVDADLGKPGAAPALGKALELTGPPAGANTTKYVDFGETIPELTNSRQTDPVDGKTTTVEYWIKTTHRGTVDNQTWNSPALFAHESGGDGDMYWGWINDQGQFGFSTSDLMEIFANGVTDGEWHHVVLTKIWNRSVPCVSRMYIDGGALTGGQTFETTTAAGDASYQDDDGAIQYLGFTQTGGSANNQFIGQIDEVAIYNKAFLEANARIHYLAVGLAPARFSITGVAIDSGTGGITITWESQAGTTYTVERAEQLPAAQWASVQQITATGASTTFVDANRPAGVNTLFYRIKR